MSFESSFFASTFLILILTVGCYRKYGYVNLFWPPLAFAFVSAYQVLAWESGYRLFGISSPLVAVEYVGPAYLYLALCQVGFVSGALVAERAWVRFPRTGVLDRRALKRLRTLLRLMVLLAVVFVLIWLFSYGAGWRVFLDAGVPKTAGWEEKWEAGWGFELYASMLALMLLLNGMAIAVAAQHLFRMKCRTLLVGCMAVLLLLSATIQGRGPFLLGVISYLVSTHFYRRVRWRDVAVVGAAAITVWVTMTWARGEANLGIVSTVRVLEGYDFTLQRFLETLLEGGITPLLTRTMSLVDAGFFKRDYGLQLLRELNPLPSFFVGMVDYREFTEALVGRSGVGIPVPLVVRLYMSVGYVGPVFLGFVGALYGMVYKNAVREAKDHGFPYAQLMYVSLFLGLGIMWHSSVRAWFRAFVDSGLLALGVVVILGVWRPRRPRMRGR